MPAFQPNFNSLRINYVGPYPEFPFGNPVWALPRSLATTYGITIVFSSWGYLDVSVPLVSLHNAMDLRYDTYGFYVRGFPHSEIRVSSDICSYARLIAACHVLLRLPVPGHPPCALSSLTLSLVKSRLLRHFFARSIPIQLRSNWLQNPSIFRRLFCLAISRLSRHFFARSIQIRLRSNRLRNPSKFPSQFILNLCLHFKQHLICCSPKSFSVKDWVHNPKSTNTLLFLRCFYP